MLEREILRELEETAEIRERIDEKLMERSDTAEQSERIG